MSLEKVSNSVGCVRGGLVLPCMLAMILLEATALKLRPDWCAFRRPLAARGFLGALRLHGGLLVLSLAAGSSDLLQELK